MSPLGAWQRRGVVSLCMMVLWACGPEGQVSAKTLGSVNASIVSGTDIGPADFPAVGGLLLRSETSAWVGSRLECTATLVSPRVILTAGHCFDRFEPNSETEIRSFTFSGEADLVRWDSLNGGEPLDAIEVAAWSVHPGYDRNAWENNTEAGVLQFDDIAVGLLAEPACRASYPSLPGAAPVSGLDVDIVGYGFGDAGQDLGVKRWASSVVGELGAWEMEIGSADAPRRCSGDSGGPTFDLNGSLIGVGSHSYGPGGCLGSSVDTRVDVYGDWIQGVLDQWGPDEACLEPSEETREPAGGCIQGSPVSPVFLLFPTIFWRRNRLRS